jgi:hypothetical protein
MRELVERYAWADEDYELAWTVSVVHGRDVDAVLSAYHADPSGSLEKLTFTAASVLRNEHFGEFGVVQLVEREGLVVVIEPNGWVGNIPTIAEKLSTNGGHFFSVYWSPVAYQIIEARDGQLVARLDPNFIGLPAGANDMLPGWVGDDDFPLDHLKSCSLAAMEQQTGLAFDRVWLTEPLPTYRIPDPDGLLKDIENAHLP